MHRGTKRRISWGNCDISCESFEPKPKPRGRPNKNNQSLTLLDNGLSLSTSFVLSMSIWAAVATPKTSWDVDVLGFCKLISWPESTVDQQQDQQREECGSHSPKDKHLRLAPSPSCIWWTTRIETWSSMRRELFPNDKDHNRQPDLLRHTGFLRVDCVERNEARVEVNQAARHVHARDGGHVERTVVTAKIAAKKKLSK